MSNNSAPRKARKLPRVSVLIFLFTLVIWVMLWGEVTAANIITGIIVATFLNLTMPVPPAKDINLNLGGLVRLFGSWTIDFVVASFHVAWLALRRADPPPTAIVKVPMRTKADITLATVMALINLQPGGIIIDVDKQEKTLTMHLLDASSTGKIDKQINQLTRMERRVIRAFENREVDEAAGAAGTAGAVGENAGRNKR